MDTSETYIKMCEKAEEIQPHFEEDDSVGGTFIGGNLLCHHQSNWEREHSKIPSGVFYVMEESYTDTCTTCGNEEEKHKVIKTIWLPRQDQLQEMIGYPDYINLLTEFIEDIAAHKTMEQFWLCLLMNHKYGKDWANNEWRNGSES